MAEIKSALEIALEKTEGMKIDKDKIQAKEHKINGRKAALSFLEGNSDDKEFAKTVKQNKGKEKTGFISGAAETFLSYIKLPSNEDYRENFTKAADGIGILSGSPKDVQQMFDQLGQFMDQYLQTKTQIEDQLRSQFEPVLKQKEEAIAAQTGSRVKLDPMDDPSFQKAYSQNIGKLEENYIQAITQAKGQLKEFLGITE